ncbi:hypothetical protein M441DRAFT_450854 [Trichoderma asperellum CBS 433.97]|uniref:Uncharacterized protein n=1 Tax=Trichoderma asperellum (strain ATCC 204424 / CBS 433.97 / NBRC 101777) TaxID=1042311 RepID=A0A2T3ZJF9_TRIA4|nr:hypothetical protein M441DRAFT_450854 [Trichoderma asperellum CBS 433.97]PTB44936.1 hypothetical protein M441DRAFT_450854 [Trichoderma asperellum CBS 433.97]
MRSARSVRYQDKIKSKHDYRTQKPYLYLMPVSALFSCSSPVEETRRAAGTGTRPERRNAAPAAANAEPPKEFSEVSTRDKGLPECRYYDQDDDSDSEFGWGDCDGHHPFGEHCEICASSFDCYCCDCYAYGAYAGDDSFYYYYRLFYWYYYCFYMDYYTGHYAERAARGSQSRNNREDF